MTLRPQRAPLPRPSSRETRPQGLLDFLKEAPLVVTAQAYRSSPLTAEEIEVLNDSVELWQSLLMKHAVLYEGNLLNNKDPGYVDMIYHVACTVQKDKNVALPLVCDALYELTTVLPGLDWELHAVEQVITTLHCDSKSRGLTSSRRVFAQHIQGLPAVAEDNCALLKPSGANSIR